MTTPSAPHIEDPSLAHRVWQGLIAHSRLASLGSAFKVSACVGTYQVVAVGPNVFEALESFSESVANLASSPAAAAVLAALEMTSADLLDDRKEHVAGCHLSHVPNILASCPCGLKDGARVHPTKVTQKTIEVTSKMSLPVSATLGGQPMSMATRTLFVEGFNALDRRLDTESSQTLFAEFQAAYDALPPAPEATWMLRLDERAYGRLVILAKEYDKSASQLASLCLAYAVAHQPAG